jgi:hypothetical protein
MSAFFRVIGPFPQMLLPIGEQLRIETLTMTARPSIAGSRRLPSPGNYNRDGCPASGRVVATEVGRLRGTERLICWFRPLVGAVAAVRLFESRCSKCGCSRLSARQIAHHDEDGEADRDEAGGDSCSAR